MNRIILPGGGLKPQVLSRDVDIFKSDKLTEVAKAFRKESPEDDKLKVRRAFNAASGRFVDEVISLSRDPQFRFSTTGATPQSQGTVVSVTFQGAEDPVDLSWVPLFRTHDFRNTREERFETLDYLNGITFRAYANGERVELYGVKGDRASIPFERLGAGFQWEQTWLDDEKYWRITDGILAAQREYANEMSDNAYRVLTDPAGLDTTSRQAGGNIVARDIATVNAAALTILQNLRAKGVRPTAPRFYLLYNDLTAGYAERIAAMLASSLGIANPTMGATQLSYPVTPLGSDAVPNGAWYLVYPGRNLHHAVRSDLMMFENFDPYTYTGDRVFWGRYITVRGDNDQVQIVNSTDQGDGDGDS